MRVGSTPNFVAMLASVSHDWIVYADHETGGIFTTVPAWMLISRVSKLFAQRIIEVGTRKTSAIFAGVVSLWVL
jgi:hypothetical protein